MIDGAFTEVERRFLEELERRGIRCLVVGMTAAVLQGARGVTEDIDLWFDVVTNVDGAEDFAIERASALVVVVSGVSLPIMPLARVVASKKASGRAKDLAQLPALEEALAVAEAERETDPNEPR